MNKIVSNKAMFGATILVPILLGIDPAIALLMNGIGTLLAVHKIGINE